jgi:hypothetical protein
MKDAPQQDQLTRPAPEAKMVEDFVDLTKFKEGDDMEAFLNDNLITGWTTQACAQGTGEYIMYTSP